MSKYKNKPITIDGIRFASQKEGARYVELKRLKDAHEIEELVLQPNYHLAVNGIHVTTYRPDFRYRDRRTGEVVVEDVKGYRTQVYKIKAKLFEAVLGVPVVEI